MIGIFGSLLQLAVISSWMFVCSMLFSNFFCKATLEQLRNGSGTECEMCPPDHFKNDTSVHCMPCPEGSAAPNGSASYASCKCKVGELFEKNGEWKLDRKRGLTPGRFLSCLMFVGVSVMFNLNKCATKLHQCIGNVRKVM